MVDTLAGGAGEAPLLSKAAGPLGFTHGFTALALLVIALQYPSPLGWATFGAASAFTLAYWAFWFHDTLEPAPSLPAEPSGCAADCAGESRTVTVDT